MSPKFRYEMQFPFKPIAVAILAALLIGYLLGLTGFGTNPNPPSQDTTSTQEKPV